MAEYGNMDQALAGLQIGLSARVDSRIAQEDINFGYPVMAYSGDENKCYKAHQDQSVVTISAPLVAADTLNITINGNAFAQTYATSSDATMTAMRNAINADPAMIALGVVASLTGASGFLTITLRAKGVDFTVTCSVTHGGGGTANATHAETTWASFLGVALFAQRSGRDYGAGNSKYARYDAVNIMNFGRIWVPVSSTGNDLDAAYVVFASGANQNTFSNASAGNKSTNGYLLSNKNTQGLAILEVRSVA